MNDIPYIISRIQRVREQMKDENLTHGYRTELNIELSRLFGELNEATSVGLEKITRHRVMRGWVTFGVLMIVSIILSSCWAYPNYSVWSHAKHGEAELKKAEWNRQIVIKESEAKYHSAKALANAEIERAKGVAEANKIIGESLKNNESYLRYLWINNMEKNPNNQVIYVPTEAGLPLLEAGRLKSKE